MQDHKNIKEKYKPVNCRTTLCKISEKKTVSSKSEIHSPN